MASIVSPVGQDEVERGERGRTTERTSPSEAHTAWTAPEGRGRLAVADPPACAARELPGRGRGALADDAERAALAQAEAATRLADRPDPVPDAVWEAAAEHDDPTALASLVTAIATTDFNSVDVAVRRPVGTW